MLDAVGNGQISNENIPEEHTTDHANAEAVAAALASGNEDELLSAFNKWKDFHVSVGQGLQWE